MSGAASRRRSRAAAHGSPEWTDRTLGAHAGSAVGRVRRVGARRVAARAARADGRLASARAHGVQGHASAGTRTRSRCRSRRSAARSTPTRRASTRSIRDACSTSTSPTRPTSSPTSCSGRRCARPISQLERKVILEEIGMVEDTPDDLVFELHNEALWGRTRTATRSSARATRVNALGVPRAARAARARVPSAASSSSPRRATSSTISCSRCSRDTGWTDAPARRRDAARVAAAASPRRRATRHVAREGAQTHIVVGSHRRRARAIRGAFRFCSSARCSAAA